MRVTTALALAVAAVVLMLGVAPPANAGGRNPDGVGIYTPEPGRQRPRLYRYDPRSWYYNRRGYYPYYGSGYWVPRAAMRYRYRYRYFGPQYRYHRAWGYGYADTCCRRWRW
jgi:hypothetical protein